MILKHWHKRMGLWIISMILISCAFFIVLRVFNQNIIFFFTPTELQKNIDIAKESNVRVGGLVQDKSIKKINDDTVEFIITDLTEQVTITYSGILPALFKEGQGTIVLGKLQDNNIFKAQELLAKHDENYMPKEVVDALKKSGKWQHTD